MSDYFNKTEEQQFEDAKSWFKENGTPILVAIIIACAATFGWNYWKHHQSTSAQQASQTFQAVMDSYSQNPTKNAALVEKFVQDNKGTTYAVFAQLEQAKQAVEKADFNAAQAILTDTLANVDDATLKTVIRFRLAEVNYQLKAFDAALTNLAEIQDASWDQRKQLFIGDILAAKGDKAAAKSAYEQAKAKAAPEDQALIDLRLNNL